MNKKSFYLLSFFTILLAAFTGEVLFLNAVDKENAKVFCMKNHFVQFTNTSNLLYAVKDNTIKYNQ